MNKIGYHATHALLLAPGAARGLQKMVLTLLPNPIGRDFILGDLHGAFYPLQALLDFVHFDQGKDRLIAVGDLFDKGLHPHECASLLDYDWFHSVRGNHEECLLAWYSSQDLKEKARHALTIRAQGGEWFFTLSDEKRALLCRKISQFPLAILFARQNQTYCVIHAEITPEIDNVESFLQSLIDEDVFTLSSCLQGRRRHMLRYPFPIQGIDFVVAGHTPIPPRQRYRENCLNLDFGLPIFHPSSALGMLEAGTNQLYLCNSRHKVTVFQDR